MPRRPVDSDKTLVADLEKGIRAVLNDKDATPAEKIQAINAGTKLLEARKRIQPEKPHERSSFFGGTRS